MARRRQEPDYGFPPARGGRGAPSMFPRKLFQILCETDPAVVGWDSDGMSFHIANFEEFVEGVMPMFYRHNKLTSFQRQLNLYGFKKMGRDEKYPGHYYHPYFQRDHPEILGGVRRSYPVTSPKWEDDEGGATPRDGAAAAVAASVAAAGSRGSSSSPRRKRAAHSPTPDMDAEHMTAVRKDSLTLQQQQQQQQQQHRARCAEAAAAAAGRLSSSASPAFDDRMQDEPGYPGGGPTAKRPWFHSSSPAAASDAAAAAAAAAAKWTNQKQSVKTEMLTDASVDDSWTAAGRAAAYSSSSSSRSAAPAIGGAVDALPRHAASHHPATNGRHWGGGAYRDQEDSYPAGGGRWYDSEESGLSRLTSCDSTSSAWDETKQLGGGGDFYDRNRSSGGRAITATVAAAGTAVGAEGDPRRSRYSPDEGVGGGGGAGGGGRSLNAHPVHRTVPTSAMFPAHFLRHERFGRYQGHSYPPPPMFLPAHTYPNPDAAPLKASRWRPVYGDGGSNGGGGGGGGSSSHDNNSSSVDGWGGPNRLAADGRGAAEWSAAAYSQDKETATLPAEAEARRKARDAGGSQSNGQQAGAGLEGEGGPRDLTRPPPSSSYRAACDEFLGDDDEDGADRGKAARFRFPLPKSSPAATVAAGGGGGGGGGAQPPSREDSVGTRRRALAASV